MRLERAHVEPADQGPDDDQTDKGPNYDARQGAAGKTGCQSGVHHLAKAKAYPVSLVELAFARLASELTEGTLLEEAATLLGLCVMVLMVAVDVKGAAVDFEVEVVDEEDLAVEEDRVEDEAARAELLIISST